MTDDERRTIASLEARVLSDPHTHPLDTTAADAIVAVLVRTRKKIRPWLRFALPMHYDPMTTFETFGSDAEVYEANQAALGMAVYEAKIRARVLKHCQSGRACVGSGIMQARRNGTGRCKRCAQADRLNQALTEVEAEGERFQTQDNDNIDRHDGRCESVRAAVQEAMSRRYDAAYFFAEEAKATRLIRAIHRARLQDPRRTDLAEE